MVYCTGRGTVKLPLCAFPLLLTCCSITGSQMFLFFTFYVYIPGNGRYCFPFYILYVLEVSLFQVVLCCFCSCGVFSLGVVQVVLLCFIYIYIYVQYELLRTRTDVERRPALNLICVYVQRCVTSVLSENDVTVGHTDAISEMILTNRVTSGRHISS